MTLLHASILFAGLAAAAIPILIHLLFRRRRPPMLWAAMEILLAALRRQERRLRLEQWLLLAARCLLFGLAGLALARPTLEQAGLFSGGRRVVTIVLDDGAASATRTDPGDARTSGFERLRTEAAALARGLQPGDSVAVVLASKPARALVAPATTDREAVARAIEALELSAAATDLSAAMTLASATGGGPSDAERAIAILSEFRLGSLDPSTAKPVTMSNESAPPRLLVRNPADDDVANVAVTSIEPQRSVDDDSITVAVRVERSGGSNPLQTVHVSLEGDGIVPVPAKSVRFEPGQASARVEFVVRAAESTPRGAGGRLKAHIEDDRMPLDDSRYASFDARGATRVGIVARRTLGAGAELEQVPASRWLARAIEPVAQPGLDVTEVEPASIDARSLRDLDALFVPRPETLAPEAWHALRAFTDRGGFVVLMPSADLDAQRWIEHLTSTFGLQWQVSPDAPPLPTPLSFAAEQPQTGIFTAVEAELPDLLRPIEVTRRVEVRNTNAADVALVLSDNSPFLLLATPSGPTGGRGLVALVVSAMELGWTNLPVKPFMVPFSQELVRRGLVRVGRADRVLVGDRPQTPRDAIELSLANGPRVAIDSTTGMTLMPLPLPGVWVALDAAGRTLGGLAANVDTSATRPTPQSREVVSAWIGGAAPPNFIDANAFATQLNGGPRGRSIGFWVLLAVAAIAVVECAMARLFSHAAIVRGSSSDPGVGSTALVAGEKARTGVAA